MKMIKPLDVVLIIAILAVTVAACIVPQLLYNSQSDGLTAQVTINGETVKTVQLSTVFATDGLKYSVENNNYHVTITFYKDGAAITESDCHDKICVNTGKLTKAGSTSVCLPARVSLQLLSGSNNIDTVAG